MYLEYFGLQRLPFTISPDPDFLFLSKGHQEAMAHLSYAFSDQGGLICLTGEVGTGKTTICRALMDQLPADIRLAYIFNPQLSPNELLENICDELGVTYPEGMSLRQLYSLLNNALLDIYTNNQKVVCVIDEAQAMSASLLEQVRLLTNLETSKEKLITLVLVGQPELRDLLHRHDLRQLSQRITARYHLHCLSLEETRTYIEHRLVCAGCHEPLFNRQAIKVISQQSGGVPRLINSIADRALLGAYGLEKQAVNKHIALTAAAEVLSTDRRSNSSAKTPLGSQLKPLAPYLLSFLLAFCVVWWVLSDQGSWPLGADSQELSSQDSTIQEQPSQSATDANDLTVNIGANNSPVILLADTLGIRASNCDNLEQTPYRCVWVDWPLAELTSLKQTVAVKQASGRWLVLSELMPSDRDTYVDQALILWRPPEGYLDLILPGQTSSLLPWVRAQLGENTAQGWTGIGPNGAEVKLNPELYDPLLEQSIIEFQQANGLVADRIIGPQTLMHMQLEKE